MGKSLKKFLTKSIVKKELKDKLAVADAKLGGSIKVILWSTLALSLCLVPVVAVESPCLLDMDGGGGDDDDIFSFKSDPVAVQFSL